MFNFLKKKQNKKAGPTADTSSNENQKSAAIEASLMRAIEEKKKKDPLIGIKMGAEEIKAQLFDIFKDKNGVNVDIVIRALSALAGFSCQMAIRETIINTGKASEKEVLLSVQTKDGKTYFMGGLLNKLLAEDQYSVWGIIAGAVQEAGGEIPDLAEIAAYGAKTIGTEDFGKPRVDEKHLMGDTSLNYLKALWPKLLPIADKFCTTPAQRHILFSMAVYKVIIQAKNIIDPNTAGILAMDTACAMSKVNPKDIDI